MDGRVAQAEKGMEEWRARGHEWPPRPTAPPHLLQRLHEPPLNADRLSRERGVGRGVADGKVWVMVVHRRVEYLRVVLEAMSRVAGIEEVLLVVSHDGFFPEVDALIRAVTFCRVKQIYLPYSAHFNKEAYPALSPEDCPPFVPKDLQPAAHTAPSAAADGSPASPAAAPASQPCYGFNDLYGHMRNPRFSSVKVRRVKGRLPHLGCGST